MNLVGKIFTVLILLMSVVFASFALAVYATQTNWRLVADNEKPPEIEKKGLAQRLEKAKKDIDELQAQKKKLEEQSKADKDRQDNAMAALRTENDVLRTGRARAEQDVVRLEKEAREAVAAMKAAHETLFNLRAEAEQLRKDIVLARADRDAHFKKVVALTDELHNAEYQRNDAMRCFHCKDELFGVMEQFAAARNWTAVAYGVNWDDQGDWRPGQKAARQHGVSAPLLEAGLGKAEIRELAAAAGLRVWDKPASACLSSRIEYGREVTREALEQVERGEDALRAMGFRQFRLRHHGDVARIEIAREELERALTLEMFARMSAEIKACGFKFVALDLEGFRSGSMNVVLPVESLRQGVAGSKH